MDLSKVEPRIVQAREVSRRICELAKLTRVAICSGNHDNVGSITRNGWARSRMAIRRNYPADEMKMWPISQWVYSLPFMIVPTKAPLTVHATPE
jgi:hypothetical protein